MLNVYILVKVISAMLRFASFAAALLLSFYSQATIYKCMIDNVATFSQQPCGKDAEIVNITPPPKTKLPPEKTQETNELSVENFLKTKEADREIERLKLESKELQKKQNERIKKVYEMTQDAANRLGAESIDDAIKKQSERINAYYNSQLSIINKQIEKLEESKRLLIEKQDF